MKEYFEIFITFLKMGCMTFGGGYAMFPIVERELVKKKAWTTMDEVMNYYTIAQITPGIIAVNLSTFVGYKQKGIPGAIIASIGFVLPGATLILAAAVFISNFSDLAVVQNAFAGIRIAVGALILDTVIKLIKGSLKDSAARIIYILVFAVSVLPPGFLPSFAKSPVFLITLSGIAGFLIYRRKRRKAAAGTEPKNREKEK